MFLCYILRTRLCGKWRGSECTCHIFCRNLSRPKRGMVYASSTSHYPFHNFQSFRVVRSSSSINFCTAALFPHFLHSRNFPVANPRYFPQQAQACPHSRILSLVISPGSHVGLFLLIRSAFCQSRSHKPIIELSC